ncbi:MAG: hypothetical protein AB1486_24545 [Planctomycetota bacterium]
MVTRRLILVSFALAIALPLAGAGDEWKDKMRTTCTWLTLRQDREPSSSTYGALQESEYFDYIYLVDAARAIWVWSNYELVSLDSTFRDNAMASLTYVQNVDPRTDPNFYIQMQASGWLVGGEMAYRLATGDNTYLTFAEACADHVINAVPDLGVPMTLFAYSEAIYWIYQWAEERGDTARRDAAVMRAGDIQGVIEATPSLLNLESSEGCGGPAFAAITTAAFHGELGARKDWVEAYAPYLEGLLTKGIYGNCHNNWYLVAHRLAWEYAAETASHTTRWTIAMNQAAQDPEGDGGIPRKPGDAYTRDGTWSTEVYALGTESSLLQDFDVTLSSSQTSVGVGSSLLLDFGLASNKTALSLCYLTAFMDIPLFGRVFLGVWSFPLPAGYALSLNDVSLPIANGSPTGQWALSVQVYDTQPRMVDEAILSFRVF